MTDRIREPVDQALIQRTVEPMELSKRVIGCDQHVGGPGAGLVRVHALRQELRFQPGKVRRQLEEHSGPHRLGKV